MKTIFTNSQLAHVWANQSQEHGKNAGGSMYFSGTEIYSYGSHFLAAKIHTNKKGERFALLNSNRYSNTTGKQLTNICNAVDGLMNYFYTSTPSDLKSTIKELDQKAHDTIKSALKRSKITSRIDIRYAIIRIKCQYRDASLFRSHLNRVEIKPKRKDMLAVVKHFDARYKRHLELNTPEMLEKKRIKKEKADIRKQEKELVLQAENVKKFRSFERSGLNLKYSILRVKGHLVETSGGANVPLQDAQMLLKKIMSDTSITDIKIGHFSLDHVTNIQNDKVIKIGCHQILLSEAITVLRAV